MPASAIRSDLRPVEVENTVRDFILQYLRREERSQVWYARKLGIATSTVWNFLNEQQPLGLALAWALSRMHPELRTSLHSWIDGDCADAPQDGSAA